VRIPDFPSDIIIIRAASAGPKLLQGFNGIEIGIHPRLDSIISSHKVQDNKQDSKTNAGRLKDFILFL